MDFSGRNFDESVTITPCVPGRSFWQTTYHEALDDLADLIAPSNIVICEGKEDAAASGFDAECYNRIFGDSHPDTVFVSRGGAKQVEKSEVLIAVLQSVAKGTDIWRLIDRDEMAESARKEKIQRDIRVLRRRELENYLFAPEVLSAFCKRENKEDSETEILGKAQELLNGGAPESADLRPVTRELLGFIKLKTQLQNLGNDRREFALEHLAPALRETPNVFQELEEDIFSR